MSYPTCGGTDQKGRPNWGGDKYRLNAGLFLVAVPYSCCFLTSLPWHGGGTRAAGARLATAKRAPSKRVRVGCAASIGLEREVRSILVVFALRSLIETGQVVFLGRDLGGFLS